MLSRSLSYAKIRNAPKRCKRFGAFRCVWSLGMCKEDYLGALGDRVEGCSKLVTDDAREVVFEHFNGNVPGGGEPWFLLSWLAEVVLPSVFFAEKLEVAPVVVAVSVAHTAVDIDAILYELVYERGFSLCDVGGGGVDAVS